MDIIRFQSDQRSFWDELVNASNNGTIFHTRKFLSYHPVNRFRDHSLVIRKKNKPFVLFPAVETVIDNKKWLISHQGASYGSFVAPRDLAFADACKLVDELVEYGKMNHFDGIRMTLPPQIYSKRLSNYLDFNLLNRGFTYYKRELSSILFLGKNADENLAAFRPSHRQAVRKSINQGIKILPSDDFESFYKILEKNLKIRHNVSPTHTLAELKKIKALFPGHVYLFGAFLESKMIGGVVNFICNDRVVLAFYISHDEDYQEFRPLNLLFYTLFDWAIKKGLSVFDFGIFTVNEEPNLGLARFKENFGAGGVFRDTLEISL